MNTIKKLIFPLSLIVIFASCKSNSKEDSRNIQLLTDSTAYQNSVTTDSVKGNARNKVASDYRYHSKETVKPSSETVKPSSNSDKKDVPAAEHHASTTSTTSSDSKSSTASTQNTSSSASQKTTKKGWSKGAQGAAIGGAAGAVGGAIISKHKGTGAAIGAAVGAASGYIIGKDREKKDKK